MKKILLGLALLLMIPLSMTAQSSMTDSQVADYVQRESARGTSQAQIVTHLMQSGVDISQIRRVRRAYEQQAKGKGLGNVSETATTGSRLRKSNGNTKLTKAQTEAMRAAVSHANINGKPWVLDPVAVGILPLRTFIAKELLRRFPAMIRGNASEILFLAGNENSMCRGMESTASSDETILQAARLAGVTRAAVLVTGATDYVAAEGAPVVAISNGSPMMARVAGIGTAQGVFGAALACSGLPSSARSAARPAGRRRSPPHSSPRLPASSLPRRRPPRDRTRSPSLMRWPPSSRTISSNAAT